MICINHNSSVPGRLLPIPFRKTGSMATCTVFCDLDGPLIDVSGRYYKTYRLAIDRTVEHYQRQGELIPVSPMRQERFWHLKLERIPDEDIAQMTGFTSEQIDFFLATVRELVNQPKLLEFDRLQPWAMSALKQLHQAGVQLSLVTLRAHDQAVQMLKRFGIYHYFASIQGSTDEFAAYDNYAHSKTAILSKTMSSMALGESESLWMIGDTEADILSAKALGVKSIALSCGMRSRAYLQRLEPYIVLDDLEAAAELVLDKLKYAEFSPA